MEQLWQYIGLAVLALLALVFGIYAATRRRLPPPEEKAPPKELEAPPPRLELPPGAPERAEVPAGVKPPAPEVGAPPPEVRAPPEGFFRRLVSGLSKTQSQLVERLDSVLRGRKEIDEGLYEELETVLLTADVGVKTATKLLEGLRQRASRGELKDPQALRKYLQDDIRAILKQGDPHLRQVDSPPLVILIIGVNGAGKTTTIGKLASRFTREGKQVILAAGDTFRAAAIEQLEVWGERSGATVVRNKEGSDPSAVIFDAVQAAKARGVDVVIADTAGRLHTKANLMEELKKVTRVTAKALPGAPHEVLLVLDATMGQNALSQARIFHEGCNLTGLILTKLDGTAKGGVIIGICDELNLPVKFIGIGEKVDDLQPFDPDQFVSALF
jgi:fused signal recognition particle receptor